MMMSYSSQFEVNRASPVVQLLKLLSGSWSLKILAQLSGDKDLRFGELKSLINGISSRMLADRLKRLVDAGFLIRKKKAVLPPEVSYRLSPLGVELVQTVNDLDITAKRWQNAPRPQENILE